MIIFFKIDLLKIYHTALGFDFVRFLRSPDKTLSKEVRQYGFNLIFDISNLLME